MELLILQSLGFTVTGIHAFGWRAKQMLLLLPAQLLETVHVSSSFHPAYLAWTFGDDLLQVLSPKGVHQSVEAAARKLVRKPKNHVSLNNLVLAWSTFVKDVWDGLCHNMLPVDAIAAKLFMFQIMKSKLPFLMDAVGSWDELETMVQSGSDIIKSFGLDSSRAEDIAKAAWITATEQKTRESAVRYDITQTVDWLPAIQRKNNGARAEYQLNLTTPFIFPSEFFADIEKHKRQSAVLNLGFGKLLARLKRNVPKLTSGGMDVVIKKFLEKCGSDFMRASVIFQIPKPAISDRIDGIVEMLVLFKEENESFDCIPVAVRFRNGTINAANPIDKLSVKKALEKQRVIIYEHNSPTHRLGMIHGQPLISELISWARVCPLVKEFQSLSEDGIKAVSKQSAIKSFPKQYVQWCEDGPFIQDFCHYFFPMIHTDPLISFTANCVLKNRNSNARTSNGFDAKTRQDLEAYLGDECSDLRKGHLLISVKSVESDGTLNLVSEDGTLIQDVQLPIKLTQDSLALFHVSRRPWIGKLIFKRPPESVEQTLAAAQVQLLYYTDKDFTWESHGIQKPERVSNLVAYNNPFQLLSQNDDQDNTQADITRNTIINLEKHASSTSHNKSQYASIEKGGHAMVKHTKFDASLKALSVVRSHAYYQFAAITYLFEASKVIADWYLSNPDIFQDTAKFSIQSRLPEGKESFDFTHTAFCGTQSHTLKKLLLEPCEKIFTEIDRSSILPDEDVDTTLKLWSWNSGTFSQIKTFIEDQLAEATKNDLDQLVNLAIKYTEKAANPDKSSKKGKKASPTIKATKEEKQLFELLYLILFFDKDSQGKT